MSNVRYPVYHDMGMIRCHRLVGYLIEEPAGSPVLRGGIERADGQRAEIVDGMPCSGCGLAIQNIHRDHRHAEPRYVANTGWAGWQIGEELSHG